MKIQITAALAFCAAAYSGQLMSEPPAGNPAGKKGLATMDIHYPADAQCPASRCFDVRIPLPEGVWVPENRVRVILPQGYSGSRHKTYPVLYLLHGTGDSYQAWTEMTDVLHLSRGLDLIIVMPDGGSGTDAGWYSDWVDGSRQWESFHIKVMIPYLEEHLRVAGDGHRAVAGISMGGFGAFSYAGRHPELFTAAASISGILDTLPTEQVGGLVFWLGAPLMSTPKTEIWGDPITGYAEWQAHNPRNLVEQLASTALFMTTGNGLPGGEHDDPSEGEGYGTELGVRATALHFRRAADEAGLAYKAFFYGPGFHDWPYFREGFVWALPQLMAEIRP